MSDFWWIKKYASKGATVDHIRFEVTHGKKTSQCKGFNTCEDKAITPGMLRVDMFQSLGDKNSIDSYPELGKFHWACFVKQQKFKNAVPVTSKNFKAKEFLTEEEMETILDAFPQLSSSEILEGLRGGNVVPKPGATKVTRKPNPNHEVAVIIEEEIAEIEAALLDPDVKVPKSRITASMHKFHQDFEEGKVSLEADDLIPVANRACLNCKPNNKETFPLSIATKYPRVVEDKDAPGTIMVCGFENYMKHPVLESGVTRPLYCPACCGFFYECSNCSVPMIDFLEESRFVFDAQNEYSSFACWTCKKPYCAPCKSLRCGSDSKNRVVCLAHSKKK